MILVRNVFRLKFGKAREAVAIMKDGLAIQKKLGSDVSTRLLTDLTGEFYTLVLELTVPSLAALETTQPSYHGRQRLASKLSKICAARRVGPPRFLRSSNSG
jgi:hypothetical protein